MSSRLPLLLLALLLAAACTTTPSSTDSSPSGTVKRTNPEPIGDLVERTNQPDPIGKFLVDLDGSIRAWSNLQLVGKSEEDRRKANLLEQHLMAQTVKRRDDLIAELETGTLNNRVVAASALGFTRQVEAQAPLLAALDDAHTEVVGNALMGLWLLGRVDTPLERVCELLQSHPDGWVRSNAALCAANLVKLGARSDCIAPAARLALTDTESGVRSQAALALATLVDTDSIRAIGNLIYDPVPLVGSAAARALAYVGAQAPRSKGEIVRILVGALDPTKGIVHQHVLRGLVELAGVHYGDEAEDWRAWADRLP